MKMIRKYKLFCSIFNNNAELTSGKRRLFSALAESAPENNPRAIITCKRHEFDHFEGTIYDDKFKDIPLASKGWTHKKSKGDYFIIHPSCTNNQTVENGKTFANLGVCNELVSLLDKQDVKNPTEVQAEGIPVVLTGGNCLLAAETGCGKTFAYLLPLIQNAYKMKHQIEERRMNSPLGLILVPGRELAVQIGEVAELYCKELDLQVDVMVGGGTKRRIMNPVFKPTDLLIGTPGVVSKLTTADIYRMNHIKQIVLDEADTLLDDSFKEKLSHFLKRFKWKNENTDEGFESTQLILASATMPKNAEQSLSEIIPLDSLHNVTTSQLHRPMNHVPQRFLRLGRADKPTQLLRTVKADLNANRPVMVFSNRTPTCDWIAMFLNENNVKCINLNADMHYKLRYGRFQQFQNGYFKVISSTDIGSRGLDTTHVQHIINYDFPLYAADYIHRCGRTGRIGSPANCRVTNFISGPREIELVQQIELAVRKMQEIPNVNGNITEVIRKKIMRNLREEMST